MRRTIRRTLPKNVAGYLARKQSEVNSGKDPRKAWDKARKTKTLQIVAEILVKMCAGRRRCMFCDDSRGTEIDHYWPIVPYRQKTFLWDNMLWVCGGCNRAKGNRFDLDPQGAPLLIDPTAEDPWDFLFFEPDTGIITARIVGESGSPHPKGQYTADCGVLPLNIEAVTEGRRRTYRSLCRAVRRFLTRALEDTDRSTIPEDVIEEIRDHDDYGLANWYFLKDGQDMPPFSELRQKHRSVWLAITTALGTHPEASHALNP